MLLDQETLRFIFGLKLRGLRLDRALSLKELSRKTGLSPSYLNEIEKGKKYPKKEKILQLATALGEDYDDLISLRLKKELSLVTQLIEKNVFSGMPFEIFGIPAATVFSLLAERPKKMSALVGTLLELARGHNITVDDFFYATLRSYLDMHQNFFPSIEEKADEFISNFKLEKVNNPKEAFEALTKILVRKFNYEFSEIDFSSEKGELAELFYFVKPSSKGNLKIYINSRLSDKEKVLIVARECGYAYMKIKSRPMTSQTCNLDSFDQLFHHFSASYFASAILIPKAEFVQKLKEIFESRNWAPTKFADTVTFYPCPVESVFHRMTQLLPQYFGLDHIFFLRFDYDSHFSKFKMVRELHLTELHSPHGVASAENYCQRWITARLLNELRESNQNLVLGIQRSQFFSAANEYLNISIAFRTDLNRNDLGCVTLGVLVNEKSQEVLKFIEDQEILRKIVSDTCERCGVESCEERRAQPIAQLLPDYSEKVRMAVEKINL